MGSLCKGTLNVALEQLYSLPLSQTLMETRFRLILSMIFIAFPAATFYLSVICLCLGKS